MLDKTIKFPLAKIPVIDDVNSSKTFEFSAFKPSSLLSVFCKTWFPTECSQSSLQFSAIASMKSLCKLDFGESIKTSTILLMWTSFECMITFDLISSGLESELIPKACLNNSSAFETRPQLFKAIRMVWIIIENSLFWMLRVMLTLAACSASPAMR